MLWIFSTLRALHGFVQRCTVRAFLPLLLVLLCVFRSTRPPIPPPPGHPFQSTRPRSERSDGFPLQDRSAHAERGDTWMISPSLPSSSLPALSSS